MIRSVLRFFYRNFLPRDIGSSLDLFVQIRAGAVQRCLASEGDLRERRLLVLAPHPDDDVIGCGGTLNRFHCYGAHITVVYMTDGTKGNDRYAAGDLLVARREEAQKAGDLLGLDRLIFLQNKDSQLSASSRTVDDLAAILNEVQPDAVFLPFLQDDHRDHIATNSVFIQAANCLPGSVTVFGYEVWTPLARPNFIVDITGQCDLKARAIEQHASQTELAALAEGYTALARYRAVLSSMRDGYAEAFFRCRLTEYKRLWRSIA